MEKVTHIIIHCSDTKDSGSKSWEAIRKYHKEVNKWNDIGYHFGIELVGTELQWLVGRPEKTAGAHCSAGHMNSHSLGVCFVGDFKGDSPSEKLYDFGAKHVAALCRKYKVPVQFVMGHRDFEKSKTCPGKMFNIETFRTYLKKYV